VPYQHSGQPAGSSCDSPPSGFDPRFMNYANFLDARVPTAQAPFKPYSAYPGNKFNGWGIHGNVTAQLMDNLELVWISSWREYESTWGMDQDGTPVPIAQLNQSLEHRAWSQEVRFNGEFNDGFFEYTLGGFYFDQDGSLQARVDLNYAGIDFIHGPDTTPSTSKALFFNGTLHPAEDLTINGGIRASWDHKTYTYFRSNPDGSIPGPCIGPPPFVTVNQPANCLLNGVYNVVGEFKGDRIDWRLAVDYRFSDMFMAYASVSTGYKGGGVNPRPFFATGAPGGPCNTATISPGAPLPCNQALPFSPETLTTYELGFKADLADRRVRLNGAFFYNDYADVILTLTACPDPRLPCLLPSNIGEAEVKGVELEAAFYPVEGLSIDASGSYLDFDYTDTGTPPSVPITAVTPYTPKWTGSIGIQYDYEMDAGTVSGRLDGSYQSDLYTDALNTPESKVEDRFLTNFRLWYTTSDENWQVALEVQNLFDKYYFHSVSDITRSLRVLTAQPGLPRTWAVTVKRNFR
jgi:iron complex outermembrane receptor protein